MKVPPAEARCTMLSSAPMIKQHMYVLAVPNLSRSGEFYRDVLGFEVREIGDKGWSWATIPTLRISLLTESIPSHRHSRKECTCVLSC